MAMGQFDTAVRSSGCEAELRAFMQQRKREVKERHEANLRHHKQAEAEKVQVYSDIARRPLLCVLFFGPTQEPAKQVPP
jgi:hypothetical protein